MPVIDCPNCNARVNVPDDSTDPSVSCPRCQTLIAVPLARPSAPPREAGFDFRPRPGEGPTRRRGPGPEPWYIPFAAGFAYVIIFGGIGVATLTFLLGVASAPA
jgi:hypothetical protein